MLTKVESPSNSADKIIERVQALVPLIQGCSEEAERDRRLPSRLIEALRAAGAYRMYVPKALGGLEVEIATYVRVLEIVSGADGSAGWNLGTTLTCSLNALALPPDGIDQLFGAGLDLIFAGTVYRANGRAIPVDGGYRLSGRWPFGSGCQTADWLMGIAIVYDGDSPRLADGAPERRLCVYRPEQSTILETWDVTGLRGTGSHDILLDDAFIPEAFSTRPGRPSWDSPLYRFPSRPRTALQISAITTGLARAALDSFDEIVSEKVPTFGTRVLRDEPRVHEGRARAEALLESGRAYRDAKVAEVWERLVRRDEISVGLGARMLLAAITAIDHAEQAVHLLHGLAGTTAIRRTHPFARASRDLNVAVQNARAILSYEAVGPVLLGLDTIDVAQLT